MSEFTQQVINGLALGSIYALIALGYTMVYGIIKLINFAHGDVMMVGAYVGYFSITLFGTNLVVALIFSMVVTAILGVAIDYLAYKPLRKSSRIAALITAIGVSLFLEYVFVWLFTPSSRSYTQNVISQKAYHFMANQVTITGKDILILSVTVILMLLLQYTVKKTRVGKAMRAVSLDQEAALLMGINVNRIISFTFAVGSALAAAAGVLIGVYYNSIDPLMGIMPGLKAFVAAVLGGIGSIPGAVAGGYILGILESLVSGYGSSLYRDAVAFGVLILILLIKPTGIFGQDTGEKV
ncbi:MAG TPA: branched-chain amino acid ABC transporter permease [Syntrophomonadaceae bacterium]|nr:branched-chain amino acid ABC transporter permease [Syntrophomonadaceae bacterium]